MIELRDAVEADVPAMFAVRTAVQQNAATMRGLERLGITPESVAQSLTRDVRGWVAVDADRVVAFALADGSNSSLFALFVLPQYQRRGIGARLLAAAMDWFGEQSARKVWLKTGIGTPAVCFYEKYGWKQVAKEGIEVRMELDLSTVQISSS